jgi:hypothetical protein
LCQLVGDRSYAKAAGASRQRARSKECSNEVSGKPGFRRVAQIVPACVGESAFGTGVPWLGGQSMSALPGTSDVNLFRYCKGIIDLDA